MHAFSCQSDAHKKSGQNPRNAQIFVPKRSKSKLSASRVVVIALT